MRHITSLFAPVACAVTLAFSGCAFAQQNTPATAASAHAPDNTAVNQRDRSMDTLTPMDQPNDKADIRLAADVRKAIIGDDALSMSARNLKLVVVGGVVTLRGPVASADEKARVETLVRGVPGVSSVDSQLDIKNP